MSAELDINAKRVTMPRIRLKVLIKNLPIGKQHVIPKHPALESLGQRTPFLAAYTVNPADTKELRSQFLWKLQKTLDLLNFAGRALPFLNRSRVGGRRGGPEY